MEFEQLWPRRRRVEIERYAEELGLTEQALDGRPFTITNFVASVDGRATVDGRSGPLGDEGDKALFRALRGEVDAVLVGTGTLEAENYGRLIRDPARRERRVRRGLTPEPILCTVTRSGSVPLDIPLFSEPEAKVIVFSAAGIEHDAIAAQLEVITVPPHELTFAAVLGHLRAERGVRALLCEGGPRVFGALAGEGVVDQLFLTLSRKFVGDGEPSVIATGAGLADPLMTALEAVLERDGTLFLRYGFPN